MSGPRCAARKRLTGTGHPYDDVMPFVHATVAAAPERLIWAPTGRTPSAGSRARCPTTATSSTWCPSWSPIPGRGTGCWSRTRPRCSISEARVTEPPDPLPERFDDVEALEEFMTRPDPALVDDLAAIDGDILVLGVGGKMGPTLARLAQARRAGKADYRSRPVLRARRRSEAPGLGHRDDSRRSARPRSGGGAAAASQRGLHGRAQVRDDGEPAAHLGDERAHSGDGGGGISRFADRRLLHRQRLSVGGDCPRRGDRGHASRRCGRIRAVLRRPRTRFRVLLGRNTARRAGCSASTTRSTCATACCGTSRARSSRTRPST